MKNLNDAINENHCVVIDMAQRLDALAASLEMTGNDALAEKLDDIFEALLDSEAKVYDAINENRCVVIDMAQRLDVLAASLRMTGNDALAEKLDDIFEALLDSEAKVYDAINENRCVVIDMAQRL